ncbi:MAG: hypothetical protein AAF773_14040 [Cyanobacteria bacterium P01_D01_bin.115]
MFNLAVEGIIMQLARSLKRLVPLVLILVITLTACSSAPSKYDQVQDDTTGSTAPAAVDKTAEKGGTFNQFFPAAEGDYAVVPSQEKQGFAEYKLKRDGETVAMLSINDTISLPAAAAKYDNATTMVAGFPSVVQGSSATGLLVNDRYQVKVLSRDASFTEADRAAWLEKFDLQGLAQLEADTKAFRKVQKTTAPAIRIIPQNSEPETVPTLIPQPAG